MNKLSDLSVLLQVDKPDIVAITETFLNEDISNSEIVENLYYVFRQDHNRHTGGVMLLVRNTISATRRTDLEDDCELLWIEISHKKGKTLFGVFYSPPASGIIFAVSITLSP